jgi:D-beta-D-heptose 7-phosphate kinase/D-beta-D-heptose 1-phosphate adenosyltransferase
LHHLTETLYIGIDSDKRVKELKGESRPFNTLEDRKYFLESLKFVNRVEIFDSKEELINLIKKTQPDFMIVGDDYKNQPVYGSEFAKNLIFFEKITEYSTTKILKYYESLSEK